MGPWSDRATDHYDPERRRFFNPWKDTDRGLPDLLRWWLTADRKPWPASVASRAHPDTIGRVPPGRAAVTFVGHATWLVRIGGVAVLTDPQFSPAAGPFGRAGPRRVRPPGITPEQLPPVHAVFVSHAHYDHLDVPSLQQLTRGPSPPRVIAPLGLGRFLEGRGVPGVTEHDWWDEVDLGEATLTLTPAQHWSSRATLARNASLWAGAHLRHRDGPTVYFAGDTGYAPYFADIRARLGRPGVALLPIGAYEPRWFMRDHHMNPDDAVRAHLDLGARQSVAMHYGCFRLSDEGYDDPVRALAAARAAHGVPGAEFRAIDVGETAVVRAV
jgi:L-ascorbate metabolism protein UlaG (beta-lactamase superfamily)